MKRTIGDNAGMGTTTEISPRAFEVLRLLADGEFHSGEAMARALGVTRGTVWNALAAIEATGVEVFRVHKRGYRLPHTIELLEAERVKQALGARAAAFEIAIVPVAASTNTDLLARAAAGARSGTVLAAEAQTAGRGRRGRAWVSPLGGALAFSLLWRFEQGAAWLAGLSLAVGVALVRALRAHGAAAQLKWPNDVLVDGAKLAGILIELQGDASGPSAVVIGVGLNLALPAAVRDAIDQPATDLAQSAAAVPGRNVLFAALLDELHTALTAFARDGFKPFAREWERLHAHQGQRVTATLPDGRTLTGVARGVAEDGALLIEAGGKTQRLISGDVSLRAQAA
jgi:BirA family biotin operon repressor/biotin-[acetyl-CoA-carboxylase] ligase